MTVSQSQLTVKILFEPDIDAFAKSITKIRAVVINSPNNPTGVIYAVKTLLIKWRML